MERFKLWIEGALVALMFLGLAGVFYERMKMGRGIGLRVIQFLSVVLVFPTVLILALEDKVNKEGLATLLGTIVGYLLSGIGSDEPGGRGGSAGGSDNPSPN